MHQCLVCGFGGLFEEPYSGSELSPSDEICPCCGFQYGFDDNGRISSDAHVKWRERWKAGGMRWWSSNVDRMPRGWSGEKQLLSLKS